MKKEHFYEKCISDFSPGFEADNCFGPNAARMIKRYLSYRWKAETDFQTLSFFCCPMVCQGFREVV